LNSRVWKTRGRYIHLEKKKNDQEYHLRFSFPSPWSAGGQAKRRDNIRCPGRDERRRFLRGFLTLYLKRSSPADEEEKINRGATSGFGGITKTVHNHSITNEDWSLKLGNGGSNNEQIKDLSRFGLLMGF
jgi:hypothetical protein